MHLNALRPMGIALAVCTLALGGCSNDSGGSGGQSVPKMTPAASVGAGEGQLNLIAWAGYAEDGSNDPKVDWVTPFEKDSGCKVNVKIGNTSDEMVQLMKTGAYDGVSASGDATLRLIAGKDVAPVNTDLVPNYADISPFLKDTQYNSVKGVNYGIPHGWGANLLMWNTEVVSESPDSWGVVFDKDSPYKGKVTAYDAPIYIADAALYLKSAQPDLGIEDPYSLNQEQFDAAVALLKDQRSIIGEYWKDYSAEEQSFEQGTSVLGTTWQVIANLASGNGATVKTVLPKEGSTAWSDTWMISSKAAHPNCMYLWMDYITRPDVQVQVAEWFGEAPANPKACAIDDTAKVHCSQYGAEDQSFYDKLSFWATPRKECLSGKGSDCVPFSEWIKAWTEIKG